MQNTAHTHREAIDLIASHFVDYLVEHKKVKDGNVKSNIKCLDPSHKDGTPSCHIYDTHAYCFGCNKSFDIFHCANFFEGKPLSGSLFYEETLPYLAKKYDVTLELPELTPEQQYKISVFRAYEDAAQIIKHSTFSPEMEKYIESRQWKKELLFDLSIGTVESYDKYKELLLERHSEDLLQSCGLLSSKKSHVEEMIFSNKSLIFTIRDKHGRPIAFSSRRIDGHDPKYVNSRESVIYKKSAVLLGLDLYLKQSPLSRGPLYIFEGQGNWVTAIQNGFTNCVALCSKAFTDDHIDTLFDSGCRDVVFCFDGDEPGQSAMMKLYEDKFSSSNVLSAKAISIPNEQDPDEYIKANGIGMFMKLEKHNFFKWYLLNRLVDESDKIDFSQICIKTIASETSSVRREQMCHDLSNILEISYEAIKQDVSYQIEYANNQDLEKRDLILREYEKQVKKNPNDAEILLQKALDKIRVLSHSSSKDVYSEKGFLSDIIAVTQDMEEPDPNNLIYLGELDILCEKLGRDWRGKWLQIAGKSNHGKTGFLIQLAREILEHNENTIILFSTLDDAKRDIIKKMMTQFALNDAEQQGIKNMSIDLLNNPTSIKDLELRERVLKIRKNAQDMLIFYASNNRLVLKGADDFNTLSSCERWITKYQERFPDKKIVFIGDNFADFKDFSELTNEVQQDKNKSDFLKQNIAIAKDITVITTMELRKQDDKQRPSLSAIKGSNAMEYDSNATIFVYSELEDFRRCGEESLASMVWHDGERRLPIVELIVAKNKMSGFKGNLFMHFDPEKVLYKFEKTKQQELLGSYLSNKYGVKNTLPYQSQSSSVKTQSKVGTEYILHHG